MNSKKILVAFLGALLVSDAEAFRNIKRGDQIKHMMNDQRLPAYGQYNNQQNLPQQQGEGCEGNSNENIQKIPVEVEEESETCERQQPPQIQQMPSTSCGEGVGQAIPIQTVSSCQGIQQPISSQSINLVSSVSQNCQSVPIVADQGCQEQAVPIQTLPLTTMSAGCVGATYPVGVGAGDCVGAAYPMGGCGVGGYYGGVGYPSYGGVGYPYYGGVGYPYYGGVGYPFYGGLGWGRNRFGYGPRLGYGFGRRFGGPRFGYGLGRRFGGPRFGGPVRRFGGPVRRFGGPGFRRHY